MAKDLNKLKTGGQFLLDSINKQSIYSREDFTSEHNEIFKMVKSFDEDRVLPQKDALDDFNPDISKGLLRELGDLGLLGVDIPEEYGGIDLDKITSAIIAESLVHNPSFAVTWSVQQELDRYLLFGLVLMIKKRNTSLKLPPVKLFAPMD